MKKSLSIVLKILTLFSLAVMVGVAFLDSILSRIFSAGIPQSARILEMALLFIAFFASALASFEKKQLALATARVGNRTVKTVIEGTSAVLHGMVDSILFWAALSLVFIGFEPGDRLLGIPVPLLVLAMPLGILAMTVSGFYKSEKKARPVFIAGILFGTILSASAITNLLGSFTAPPEFFYYISETVYTLISKTSLVIILFLVFTAFAGLPLYALISGIAGILFISTGSSIELIPSEAYMLFKNSSMPAIPLFTVAGFMLSESDAGKRLVNVFRNWFGWIPGGEAFAAVLVCAFFTTFTGANGVTILALGGILAYVLTNTGAYSENYARGLLTASSSLGLMFPPSLAIILYAVNAQFLVQGDASAFTITEMFIGGIIPGILLTLAMGGAGIIKGIRTPGTRQPFELKPSLHSLKAAIPELLVPLIIISLYFTGWANITEIGAIIIIYLGVFEFLIKGKGGGKEMVKAVLKAVPVAGGALIVIASARALSFFIMDTGVPEAFSTWMQATVSSKALFLLLLNLGLLLVGCLMDIFSAVLVISPLVIPLAATYGVHPVHLGVIFIMNLSIGFLTPPIGMNLFLASYAFDRPVMKIYRDVLPFFFIQLAVLAIVTWVPWLSLALL